MMKREWKKPMLEMLEIDMTMGGRGAKMPDCFDNSDKMPPGQEQFCPPGES
ncbi:paeninodin family lasso peptide [Salipaludibacillus sp. HK11]|uniref:paeninodin family lasso peptide n=1 Tax=Salipaludibacillus sp. HK11 TaxID=3394320 RepID=UPI0039FCB55C